MCSHIINTLIINSSAQKIFEFWLLDKRHKDLFALWFAGFVTEWCKSVAWWKSPLRNERHWQVKVGVVAVLS